MKLKIDESKPKKCKHCKKIKGEHQAKTLNCPAGMKTRIGHIQFHPENVFEPMKTRKKKEKKSDGITNVRHIASIGIPIDPKKTDWKYIFAVGSASERIEVGHRTWFFAESLEKAIELMYSWDTAQVFSESRYYDYVVIQKIPLNCVEPAFISSPDDNWGQTWFKLIHEKILTPNENIRESLIPCDTPERFKGIIGFY
jgi:hypothetical protein